MTEEIQVQSTEQGAEQTQPVVEQQLESTTSGDVVSTPDPSESSSEQGKDPNGWALKRIGELTRQRHDAERQAQASKGEAERYRLIVEQMRNGDPSTSAPVSSEQPNIDDLVAAKAKQIAQQESMAQRGQSVAKAGGEAYQDFQTAVSTLDALGITQDSVESILSMDDAHKVLYTLGKNPEEAARILSLPPLQQGRELERLSLKSGQQQAKPVSQAPAPITPIDGSTTVDADPSKMTMDEWTKWRAKTAKTRI